MTRGVDAFLRWLHCNITAGMPAGSTVYMRPWRRGDATRGIRGMVLVIERPDVTPAP